MNLFKTLTLSLFITLSTLSYADQPVNINKDYLCTPASSVGSFSGKIQIRLVQLEDENPTTALVRFYDQEGIALETLSSLSLTYARTRVGTDLVIRLDSLNLGKGQFVFQNGLLSQGYFSTQGLESNRTDLNCTEEIY